MKARELRLGNIVLAQFGPIVITELKMLANDSDEKSMDIPITEEWLKKFGFIEHEDREFYSEKEPLFGIKLEHTLPGLKTKINMHIWDGSFTHAPCEYVHQLQNLYFALTAKELTLDKEIKTQ